MTDTPQDLLQAVDAITKPVALIRWQDTTHDHRWEPLREYVAGACGCSSEDRPELCPVRKDGKHLDGKIIPGQWTCKWCDTTTANPIHTLPEQAVRRRTDAPLLDQLRDAVASSLESGGSGKPGRERIPIDTAAFDRFEDIDGKIRSWLDELGARPGKNITATQALRTWYVLWSAGQHVDGLEARKEAELLRWEQQIQDVLQPPKRIEITAPCPLCGAEWVNVAKLPDGTEDIIDVEMVRVLNAVERPTLEESYAVCQGCSAVWLGVSRMRQLRIDIDDRAAAS